MAELEKQSIEFMRRACLLCDNSCLEVKTGCLIVKGQVLIKDRARSRTELDFIEGWNVRDLSGEFSNGVIPSETRNPEHEVSVSVISEGWNKKNISKSFPNGVRHAEEMAIARASDLGISPKGSTVYVTRFPCDRCSKLLVTQGISRIFYMSDHFTGGNKSLGFLQENGIEVIQISEEEVWR